MKAKYEQLFTNDYLKRELKFDISSISNLDQIKKDIKSWKSFIEQGTVYSKNEEQLQSDFLNLLFGEVLGYEYKRGATECNLEKEEKSKTDSTKPDGVLGYFTETTKTIRAVIELKDANTNLDKPQNRLNDKRTPVEQGFSYVSKSGGNCDWVIISNFKEIRLYPSNDSSKYQVFEIVDLLIEENLRQFLGLLSKDRLLSHSGVSSTSKLLKERLNEEDRITNEFYKKYKALRLDLYQHLKNENPDKDGIFLLSKTQKILDRVIFVCFCEDLGLLPYKTFRKILDIVKQDKFDRRDNKLWIRVKGLFESIDKGYPEENINKFNGGLFREDKELDSLIIKDELLKHVLEIEGYKFNSDLNVNILGHIFEQSITDLEEMKSEIAGVGFDKKKGKRKKDGVFYTPEYITKYIVNESVGGWLEDRKQELGFDKLEEITPDDWEKINKGKVRKGSKLQKKIASYIEIWEKYREKLFSIKVIDPSCGSGSFLVQVFDYLKAEGQVVNEEIAKLQGRQPELLRYDKHILSNNLYGVDINRESVEITKLSLWLKTMNKNEELTTLDDNIKCGNSLIDDESVDPEHYFKWEEEFPKIFEPNKKCILCDENPANSREHYPIKADIFRNKNKENDYIYINKKTGERKKVNSYNDKIFKPRKNLCKHCNNVATQKHDNIFSDFHKQLVASIKNVNQGHDKLKECFWNIDNFIKELENSCSNKSKGKIKKNKEIKRYFSKMIACEIDNKGYKVPEFLQNLCINNGEMNKIKVSFLTKTILELPKEISDKCFDSNTDFVYDEKELTVHIKNIYGLVRYGILLELYEPLEKKKYEGFDVVVGNPPYVQTEYISHDHKKFFEKNYFSGEGRINVYPLFYEKGLNLLKRKGYLGYITPYTILKNQYYIGARRYILSNSIIKTLVDFQNQSIFKNVSVDTIILLLKKEVKNQEKSKIINKIQDFQKMDFTTTEISQTLFEKNDDLSFNISNPLIEKCYKDYKPLQEVIDFNQGIITGNNNAFLTNNPNSKTQKVLRGGDFNRYSFSYENLYIIYDKEKLHRPRKEKIFEAKEKVLLRQTGSYPIATLDTEQYYTLDTVHNGIIIDNRFNSKYLLCIINSNLFKFLYETQINEVKKTFAQVKIVYMKPLPIKFVEQNQQAPFIKKADIMLAKNKELAELSDKFFALLTADFEIDKLTKKLKDWHSIDWKEFKNELTKKKIAIKGEQEENWLERHTRMSKQYQSINQIITKTDNEINNMVYKLYDLTPAEINIVEGKDE